MFFMKKYSFLIFSRKKRKFRFFSEKKNPEIRGKPGKVLQTSKKLLNTPPRCLHTSRKHKIKPKNSFQWLKFDRKTNRKFAGRSRDLMIKYWKLVPTMWKPNMSPFRKWQVFENRTDSLGITAYQTRVPSKHRNRGQRREKRPFIMLPHIETTI
jgi:hypothetical protein